MVTSIEFPNNNPPVWVRMFVHVCSFGLGLALGEGHSRWKRALNFMCSPNFFSGIITISIITFVIPIVIISATVIFILITSVIVTIVIFVIIAR